MKNYRIRTSFLFPFMIVVFLFMITAFGCADDKNANSYPPDGWITDIAEAYSIAQREDKEILINFTGSDWCVWCKRLSKEVFETAEFNDYAKDNLVLLFIDSPSGIELSEEQKKHNEFISQYLGIQGYPTIWLFDKDLGPLLSTGYRKGGASAYISHLKNDRPAVSKEKVEEFRTEFIKAIEENWQGLR